MPDLTAQENPLKKSHRQGPLRFELPPDAEKHLVWYPFIKRLPTTIFWLSVTYILGFVLLNIGLWIKNIHPTGWSLWLYYLRSMGFGAALILCLTGW